MMVMAPIFYFLTQLFVHFTPQLPIKMAPKLLEDSLTKHVYLSFDDGPLPGTSNVIDICTNAQAEATFFEVGLHQSRSKFGRTQYARILSNPKLFALCNHSFSHAYGEYLAFYHQPDSALKDFIRAKEILKPSNTIARLPGNNAWNTAVIKRASSLVRPLVEKMDSVGFNVIGWDLQWLFNKAGRPVQTPEHMADLVDSLFFHQQTRTKNHLVILMHDHMFRAPQDSTKLAQFIFLLKSRPAYQLNKLTSYPGMKNGGY
jgi:peptidoglycan/xylan/chitin deacetylase (PgdA/CDA1 family)